LLGRHFFSAQTRPQLRIQRERVEGGQVQVSLGGETGNLGGKTSRALLSRTVTSTKAVYELCAKMEPRKKIHIKRRLFKEQAMEGTSTS